MDQELNFSVDSRLLEELGENLVTKNHIALSELIKNAYDADASKVKVSMQNAMSDAEEGIIVVEDDGLGMTPQEIRDNWMRIATTNKRRNPRSEKYKREKAGNKGIGRFACRRLANELTLVSKAEDSDGEVKKAEVDFNWQEEFEGGQDIDQPGFEMDIESTDEDTGVTLILEGLRDKWTQRDFDTLRRQLVSLSAADSTIREVNGEQIEDPGFDIELEAEEFEGGEGSLAKQAKDSGWGRLQAEVDQNGVVNITLEAKKLGDVAYELPKKYPKLAGTTFDIAYIPRKKEHFRDPKTLSLEAARGLLNEQGGIRAYQDNFRVYPYGGPDDDWLGIDKFYNKRTNSPDPMFKDLADELKLTKSFSRTMISFPKNDQLFGAIYVDTSEEGDLTQKADREGFKNTESLRDLKQMVRESLQWMTLQYDHYRALKSEEDAKEAKEDFDEETGEGDTTVDEAVEFIEEFSDNVKEVAEDEKLEEASQSVEDAARIIEETVEQKDRQLEFLRSAFSVNQLIFGFAHEARSMLQNLEHTANRVNEIIDEVPDEQKEPLRSLSEEISSLEERFEQQIKMFGIFMENATDEERLALKVERNLHDVCDSMSYLFENYNIELEFDIEDRLRTPKMYKTEFYSIVVNLLTNSIKAIAAKGESRKTETEGRIKTEAFREDDAFVLRVYDDGIGFSGDESEAFQPLTADPEDELYDKLQGEIPEEFSAEMGAGSGLGLSVVRNIVKTYEGETGFIDAGEDFITCVEVRLSYE